MSDNLHPMSPDEKTIVSLFRHLTVEQKQEIIHLAEASIGSAQSGVFSDQG